MSKNEQQQNENVDKQRRHQDESSSWNHDTVWHPRTDLTKDQVSELQTKLDFVKEGIVKVNMMILTCSVLWQSCTWNSHPESKDAMLECAEIHFLEVTNVFLDYLKIAYYPPCIRTTDSPLDDSIFDEEPPKCETWIL
ncbi:unnamed protein product [Cylindrotheca closterium]|uniref:Uncharacterized protein n=1 Tax=Cylindrotheca closterium TaxID=2856 RepID=A0AAD2CQH6_9STRA|nr:unnamed protein product [Cylindrotheca closterium]